jgi:hypothetical protein
VHQHLRANSRILTTIFRSENYLVVKPSYKASVIRGLFVTPEKNVMIQLSAL